MHVYTSRIGRSLLRISKLRLVFEISSFNIDSVGFLDLQLTLFQNYSFVLLVSPPVRQKDLGITGIPPKNTSLPKNTPLLGTIGQ